jgi:long-chain acyl-CoA synthetase
VVDQLFLATLVKMEPTSFRRTTHPQGSEYFTRVANQAVSLAQMFVDRIAQTPDREAYRYPPETNGCPTLGARLADRLIGSPPRWSRWASLRSSGWRLCPGRVTNGAWLISQLCVPERPRHPSIPQQPPEIWSSSSADSSSQVVFAEDDDQIVKLREQCGALPAVRKVITFDGTPDDGDDPWVVSLDWLAELARHTLAEHPDAVDDRIAAIRPEHLATLIYTSGTTGRPKGVRLNHSSWTYEGAAVAALGVLDFDDLQYLWLPMAHAFGKVLLTTQL